MFRTYFTKILILITTNEQVPVLEIIALWNSIV